MAQPPRIARASALLLALTLLVPPGEAGAADGTALLWFDAAGPTPAARRVVEVIGRDAGRRPDRGLDGRAGAGSRRGGARGPGVHRK